MLAYFAYMNDVPYKLDHSSRINRNATYECLTLHYLAYLMMCHDPLIFHTCKGLMYTVWAANGIRDFFLLVAEN